jgi:hypothetical protein
MFSMDKKRGILLGAVLFWGGICLEAAPVATPEEESVYVYQPKSRRDPFLPLAGSEALSGGSGEVDHGSGVFDIKSVALTGILKTPTGRWAVLRSPEGGSYLVKNGKIYNFKHKQVEGYVGIVKEKSLVIIDSQNQVTELKLKKNEGVSQ